MIKIIIFAAFSLIMLLCFLNKIYKIIADIKNEVNSINDCMRDVYLIIKSIEEKEEKNE